MMRRRFTLIVGVAAMLVASAGTAHATILTFLKNAAGATPANNSDLNVPYGSNVTAANIIGATDGGEGFTPNIALQWAPTGGTVVNAPDIDILEFHSATTFVSSGSNPGPGFTVPVLQFDIDISNHTVLPGDPMVDFVPDAGWAVKIHDLRIGNANDQGANEQPYSWTISVLALPSLTPTGSSYTTAALSGGSAETAAFNFTGLPGASYRLQFHANTDPAGGVVANPRTAIDNVRFSQVQVPEPATISLVALCGLGVLGLRRRGL